MQDPAPSTPPPPSEGPQFFEWVIPDWVPEPVLRFWGLIQEFPFLGKLLVFIVLIVLGYVAGKIAEAVLLRGLKRLTSKTRTDLDDRILDLVHRPIFHVFFFGGLMLATRSLSLPEVFADTTVRILGTILVLIWLGAGFPLCRLMLEVLAKLKEHFSLIEERTLPLFEITLKLLLFGGATYAALLIWNIDPTAWLASAGVIGIAVGFAAKDTMANLFGGFFILADAPYKIGDFIVIESGERGRVAHVGLRSTRLETRDDIEITVPNASIANAKIINESGGKWEKERIRIKVGVAYGSDLDQVCAVLEQTAVGHEHICADPAPRVRLRGFGDSSVDFELLCWIDEPVLRGRLSHDLYMDVYKVFGREGIEIPYPKHDVYIQKMPGS